MRKWEQALARAVQKNIVLLATVVIFLATLLIRIYLLPFFTWDMATFLCPWVNTIRENGIGALASGVGNYNVLYMLYLSLLAYLPLDQAAVVFSIKGFSILFDFAMAGGIAWLVYTLRAGKPNRRNWAYMAFAAACMLPLPILNSAFWGQCDSIYATFCILAVGFLIKEKHLRAFLCFGLAVCFKFQAIFLLPLFIIVYLANRKFQWWLFALPPLMLFLSGLPIALMGGSLWASFGIYAGQMDYDRRPYIDFPGVAALFQDQREEFFTLYGMPLIVLALLVCFVMLALILYKNLQVRGEGVLALAAWSVMACVLFLPSMHERYAYVGEILLVVWFLVKPSWRRLAPALMFNFASYCAYASYLFGLWPVRVEVLAAFNLVTFIWFGYETLRTLRGASGWAAPVGQSRQFAQTPVATAPQSAFYENEAVQPQQAKVPFAPAFQEVMPPPLPVAPEKLEPALAPPVQQYDAGQAPQTEPSAPVKQKKSSVNPPVLQSPMASVTPPAVVQAASAAKTPPAQAAAPAAKNIPATAPVTRGATAAPGSFAELLQLDELNPETAKNKKSKRAAKKPAPEPAAVPAPEPPQFTPEPPQFTPEPEDIVAALGQPTPRRKGKRGD